MSYFRAGESQDPGQEKYTREWKCGDVESYLSHTRADWHSKRGKEDVKLKYSVSIINRS